MLPLIAILLVTWIKYSQAQKCVPIQTVPPKPVIPSLPVTMKQLGASWKEGKFVFSFRRFNFQKQEFLQPANRNIKRKEYRQMSRREMRLFHEALNRFHNTSHFNLLVNEHERWRAPSAHFGVAFLGWHRQYLYILEQSLRALDPKFKDMYFPYWDSSLDHDLPSPHDSAVWTFLHWGTGDGAVHNGKLCKNWGVNPACWARGAILTRGVMEGRDFLYNRDMVTSLLTPALTFTALMINRPNRFFSQFEADHGLLHCYVGGCQGRRSIPGHMASLLCAPNDPLFFMHHCFVDYLWYEWAKMPNRTNTYPVPGVDGATVSNMGGTGHLGNAPMRPFPGLTNADGHKENFYSTYEERPSLIQCSSDSHCKSPTGLLFCHNCRCMATIRRGGNCTGLSNNACHCPRLRLKPKCRRNRCGCFK